MAENASDLILEFDRENDWIDNANVWHPGAHQVRPVYHNGTTRIPGEWRLVSSVWAGMASAASHNHVAFDDFMAQEWPQFWASTPVGVAEKRSACNQVREIVFLAALP